MIDPTPEERINRSLRSINRAKARVHASRSEREREKRLGILTTVLKAELASVRPFLPPFISTEEVQAVMDREDAIRNAGGPVPDMDIDTLRLMVAADGLDRMLEESS